MILIGIFLFGLVAPFLIIYGGIVFLLVMPFLALIHLALPHWQRLAPGTRSAVVRYTLWASSISLWAYAISSIN